MSATVAAVRQFFGSPAAGAVGEHAWPLQHPIIASIGWSAPIMAVFIPLAVRRYRTATTHQPPTR